MTTVVQLNARSAEQWDSKDIDAAHLLQAQYSAFDGRASRRTSSLRGGMSSGGMRSAASQGTNVAAYQTASIDCSGVGESFDVLVTTCANHR